MTTLNLLGKVIGGSGGSRVVDAGDVAYAGQVVDLDVNWSVWEEGI